MSDTLFVTPAIPEIMLACFAMLTMVIGVFVTPARQLSVVRNSGLVFLALTLLGVIMWYPQSPIHAFGGLFISNSLTAYIKILLIISTIGSLLIAKYWLRDHKIVDFEYVTLHLFALIGMMVMVSANDFLSLYVGLELQSLALYVLACINRHSNRSSEAAIKYFVLGAIASGLFLYGVSLLYGFSGSTAYSVISHAPSNFGIIIGVVFVVAALCFKIAAAPFHMWSPDVYEGASTPVVGFFATVPKVAGVIVLAMMFVNVFDHYHEDMQPILQVIAAASLIIGSFVGLVQTNIKRLMAYSSIAHVGFIVATIASGSPNALEAIILYVTIYAISTLGMFALILTLRLGDGVNNNYTENIDDFKGLAKTNPKTALAIMLLLFSMAGIPPLGGFFAKFYALMAIIDGGLFYLAIIAVVTSVISAFYYLRIICYMYFAENTIEIEPSGGKGVTVVACISVFSMIAGAVLISWLGSYVSYMVITI